MNLKVKDQARSIVSTLDGHLGLSYGLHLLGSGSHGVGKELENELIASGEVEPTALHDSTYLRTVIHQNLGPILVKWGNQLRGKSVDQTVSELVSVLERKQSLNIKESVLEGFDPEITPVTTAPPPADTPDRSLLQGSTVQSDESSAHNWAGLIAIVVVTLVGLAILIASWKYFTSQNDSVSVAGVQQVDNGVTLQGVKQQAESAVVIANQAQEVAEATKRDITQVRKELSGVRNQVQSLSTRSVRSNPVRSEPARAKRPTRPAPPKCGPGSVVFWDATRKPAEWSPCL